MCLLNVESKIYYSIIYRSIAMFDWCWYQIDTKILVVHSSVVHIELLLRSRITILKVGFFRSYTYSDSCSWNMLSWVILSWGMKHLISINAVHSPNLIIWFKANFINSESLKRTESKSNHLAPSKVSRFSRSRSIASPRCSIYTELTLLYRGSHLVVPFRFHPWGHQTRR